ncbi:universal stress protein [Tunturiibacter gelidiferens]|uniref:universal stress protein n=1 Tax=Tunturiibacter gelidiferens TaxID=3069689 RepID=UPI003D9AE789
MITLVPKQLAFERILVPTDFSDVSQRALDYAKSVAQKCGSQILLAHVDQPINPITPPEREWIDRNASSQQVEQELEQQGAELRSEGFKARTISVPGAVQDAVLSTASREGADLIVLGTHSSAGVERLLSGSDAEEIFRNATCPVLVIGPVALPPSGFTWPPKHVVCASDLDPNTASVAAYSYMLAREYKATFTLLHVEDPTNRRSDLQEFEKAYARALPDQPSPNIVLRTASPGDFNFAIIDFLTVRNVDLLMMGAHTASSAATHFLRGIVPQVVADAPCPVMVLHK